MIDLLRQIKNDLDAAGNVTSLDAKWLVTEVERLRDEVKKWDGERDPTERRADYAELRTQLHTATGVAADVPISMFGLVGVLIQQRDEARRASATVTGCPEAHPDRPDIRCTQDRHENGHLYHRNSHLGVEWWASGDGYTNTIHDVLGPIQFTQRPVRPDVEIRAPYIGGATKSPTRERQPGRYHTLPPCEDDPEDHPQCGAGNADYPELRCVRPAGHKTEGPYEYHADNKQGAEWSDDVATCGAGNRDYPRLRCGLPVGHSMAVGEGHVDPERNARWFPGGTVHGPTVVTTVAAPSDPDSGPGAGIQVYQAIVPVLEGVAGFLRRMGTRYRDGNHRMTSELCRTAETHSDTLTAAAKSLRDLVDTAAQAEQQRALAAATTVRQWLNAAQTYIEGS